MRAPVIGAVFGLVGFDGRIEGQFARRDVAKEETLFGRDHLPFRIDPSQHARHHRQLVNLLLAGRQVQFMQFLAENVEPPDGIRIGIVGRAFSED